MPRKLRELRGQLRREGFGINRQTGSHQMWVHLLVPGVSVNLAGKDGDDARPYQEKQLREAMQTLRDAQRRLKP